MNSIYLKYQYFALYLVTFGQFSASLQNKSISYQPQTFE